MRLDNQKEEADHHQDRRQKIQQNPESKEAGRVKIDFYTDPLCCWSWALDQHWRRLRDEYKDKLDYRYIMCGMIPDWHSYNDPMSAVSRPIQMGPIWMHASEMTNVKMKYSIWHENPPASSYPACIAVKVAAQQSQEAEDAYLLAVRKALMEDGKDISRPEVLLGIAEQTRELDYKKFINDWRAGSGHEAFRQDLQQARFHKIGRFPTLTFRNEEGRGIVIVGYRPFEVLKQAWDSFVRLSEAT